MLVLGLEEYERRMCGCGCGEWDSISHDPDNEGRFRVVESTCYARAAIHEWSTANKPAAGVMIAALLMPAGETVDDQVRREIAETQARLAAARDETQ